MGQGEPAESEKYMIKLCHFPFNVFCGELCPSLFDFNSVSISCYTSDEEAGSSRPYPTPKPTMTKEERIQLRKAKRKTAENYTIDQILDKVGLYTT